MGSIQTQNNKSNNNNKNLIFRYITKYIHSASSSWKTIKNTNKYYKSKKSSHQIITKIIINKLNEEEVIVKSWKIYLMMVGKNGIGIVIPDNISDTIIKILTIPFSSKTGITMKFFLW